MTMTTMTMRRVVLLAACLVGAAAALLPAVHAAALGDRTSSAAAATRRSTSSSLGLTSSRLGVSSSDDEDASPSDDESADFQLSNDGFVLALKLPANGLSCEGFNASEWDNATAPLFAFEGSLVIDKASLDSGGGGGVVGFGCFFFNPKGAVFV